MLSDYVRKKELTIKQAVKVVEDMLFSTSNVLYDLKLPLKPLVSSLPHSTPKSSSSRSPNLQALSVFLSDHPDTKFLRLQYLDYTATLRLRVLPVKRALSLLQGKEANLSIGITKCALGLLQNDTIIPEITACGEYKLHPIFTSLRPGPSEGYASVQGEFRESDGSQVDLCPRSVLRRMLEKAKSHGLEFLAGFEIEIVFMSRSSADNSFKPMHDSGGHCWNSARAFHGKDRAKMLMEIYDTLVSAGIYLEQWHPESSSGQYEFILPPLPPLEAVDTLLHTREIISTVVANYDMRATLFPKPFPMQAGTASHVHISISSPNGDETKVYESFYAGILNHLRAIAAFTYSNAASYDRVVDGVWAGGRWVTWGSQNRETALRKIEGSHWEIKCLDGLANVYFALAAILAAGTNGVIDGDELAWGDCQVDPATLNREERDELGIEERLPQSLDEAIEALLADRELRELLGNDLVVRYVAVKKAETKLLNGMKAEERREWIMERY